jgi:hypothetical protein
MRRKARYLSGLVVDRERKLERPVSSSFDTNKASSDGAAATSLARRDGSAGAGANAANCSVDAAGCDGTDGERAFAQA